MRPRLRSLGIAGFLLLCIFLGGSSQSPWTNLALQIIAVALLTRAAIGVGQDDHGKRQLAVNLLLICALLVILVQLIPLPAELWTRLPGRAPISQGLAQLGYSPAAAPVSLMPWTSVATLFFTIPAIAAFAVTERLGPSPRAIALAIVAGTIAAVLVGAMQVAGGPAAWAYFYRVHNPGAVGFFANGNHMASLLLVSIPMTAALVVTAKKTGKTGSAMPYGIGIAVLVLVLIGIVLNGSRAAFGLALPVVVASISLFPAAVRWRGAVLVVSALSLAAAVALLLTGPLNSVESGSQASTVGSRAEIWGTTTQAIRDTFPVGTGLGTFDKVYHAYEDPRDVGRAYVNHAHNDYLEMVLELGAAGLLLIVLFLGWWVVVAAKIWTSPYSNPFARAATIVTAVLLAHSIVDFPLRTAAMSTIFATCIALMAQHLRPTAFPNTGESRPTRHVSLG